MSSLLPPEAGEQPAEDAGSAGRQHWNCWVPGWDVQNASSEARTQAIAYPHRAPRFSSPESTAPESEPVSRPTPESRGVPSSSPQATNREQTRTTRRTDRIRGSIVSWPHVAQRYVSASLALLRSAFGRPKVHRSLRNRPQSVAIDISGGTTRSRLPSTVSRMSQLWPRELLRWRQGDSPPTAGGRRWRQRMESR